MLRRICTVTILIIAVVALVACGTAPTPTPVPTQPPIIQTVIITATPVPVTATPVPPTPTAVIPTVAVVTPTVAATTAPTKAAVVNTPRPAPTRTPTRPAATATATPLPLKFGAPVLNSPIWTDSQKDQVVARGGAIVLDWKSVGGLGGDECYRIDIRTEPINPGPGVTAKGDYWVVLCGDQTAVNSSVKFTIESPLRGGSAPNYGSIEPDGEVWAFWTLTVVKNLGSCDAGYPYHCKTVPISAPSRGYFKFIRAS